MSYPTHTNTADLKMSSTFSTAELTSLERQVEIENKSTKLSDIWTANDLNRCIKFQREGEFQNICLQFSDEIVTYAVEIERQLKKHIEANIYLLADTSYGSCCVDEVRSELFCDCCGMTQLWMFSDRCQSRCCRFHDPLWSRLPFESHETACALRVP